MDINNINNSGDWNTFNQNIGGRTVEDIFDKGELAQEWCHKKMVRDNAFSARMKRASVKVVVAAILLAIYFSSQGHLEILTVWTRSLIS